MSLVLTKYILHFSHLVKPHLSYVARKPVYGVSDQNMARCLKFWDTEVKGLYYLCGMYYLCGLYYLCGENKGADQLGGYRTADLCLCFAYAKNQVCS